MNNPIAFLLLALLCRILTSAGSPRFVPDCKLQRHWVPRRILTNARSAILLPILAYRHSWGALLACLGIGGVQRVGPGRYQPRRQQACTKVIRGRNKSGCRAKAAPKAQGRAASPKRRQTPPRAGGRWATNTKRGSWKNGRQQVKCAQDASAGGGMGWRGREGTYLIKGLADDQ